jgi:tryptophan halogenase
MNIVIAGGGTAGWLAAFIISKSQPNQHTITVVESSKIGIIGAGEGSTGLLVQLLNGFYFKTGIDAETFKEHTDGTNKLGILHKNWSKDGSDYFAPLDGSITSHLITDFVFHYGLANFGKKEMHKVSQIGQAWSNKMPDKLEALHFDGHKVGMYLKSLCLTDGVIHIDSEINTVEASDQGRITELRLSNGQSLKGDFFFDCTGFAKVLMKKLEVPWVSYKKHLPVDTAMPFIVKYKENEQEPLPATTATALSSGWMWDIPLSTRRGCGYVFDSSYISKDEARAEIETKLGHEIEPIKFINFESGRSQEPWKNNCISLGLAGAFAEPLEATSIHTTIVQILTFVNEFLMKNPEATIRVENQKSYNQKITKLYDYTLDFLVMHYQGGKTGSAFWDYISTGATRTDKVTEVLERAKRKIPGILEFEGVFGSPYGPLWNWILAGIDIITPNQAFESLSLSNFGELAKELCSDFEFENYVHFQHRKAQNEI